MPEPPWTVRGGVGYVHPEFVNIPANDPTGARNGARVPGVPMWSGNVALEHRLPLEQLGLAGDLVSVGEVQFVGGHRAADIANTFDLRAYTVANARIGWQSDNYKIYAFGRNLFDETIELAGAAYTPTVLTVTPGLGRVVGLGAEIIF